MAFQLFVLLIQAVLLTAYINKKEDKVKTYNGTPQMGWNSWNKFACDISQEVVMETADALILCGLAQLGYTYVNLDDCWHANERADDGTIMENKERFPSGMKALGDYVHAKGLQFGIYSSAGFKTCQGFPASLGLELTDAESYYEWGVDYLKYDNCYQDSGPPEVRFKAMGDALREVYSATNRSMFYSMCQWGRENPAVWASTVGANSWRVSGDIKDEWRSLISRVAIDAPLWRYAGSRTGWNDPDMLEVGNGGCTLEEYKAHFSLWSVLKAPLILGNDIRTLVDGSNTRPTVAATVYTSEILEILSNAEVIAINQDALGYQARLVWSDVSDFLSSHGDAGYNHRLIATKCVDTSSGIKGYSDDAMDQDWRIESDGTIRSSSTGFCLNELSHGSKQQQFHLSDMIQALTPSSSPSGSNNIESYTSELEWLNVNASLGLRGVSTANCADATRWDVGQFVGGSIVSRSSGSCLEVAKIEELPSIQGKRIQTAPCQSIGKKFLNVREHQSWTAPHTNRLLNLYQRQCLTVDRDAYIGIGQEIWSSPLSGGSYVVLLFNKGPVQRLMTFEASVANIPFSSNDTQIPLIRYTIRDLWTHQDMVEPLSQKHSKIIVSVKSHSVSLLKLTPSH